MHDVHWLVVAAAVIVLFSSITSCHYVSGTTTSYRSILGDPGMNSSRLRVEFEAWNFCNGATGGPVNFPSPRYADCFDTDGTAGTQLVPESANELAPPSPIPHLPATEDEDQYAVEKEQYLGSLCAVQDGASGTPWYFWNIMAKSGNFNPALGYCPATGLRNNLGSFTCWNSSLCMNQPLVVHVPTAVTSGKTLYGSFSGTYDVFARSAGNQSRLVAEWTREADQPWQFSYSLTTSDNYPWLMLYHRADAATGISGGYASNGRGIMLELPSAPDFLVRVFLNVSYFAPVTMHLQFYMPEMAACWKLDGAECDGDNKTDITRYFEFVLSPQAGPCGTSTSYGNCPPFHTYLNGTRVARTDPRFPFSAYHQWCPPPGSGVAGACDPYSNPQPQELIMTRPDPEWAVHGFPSTPGEGWIGDARLWELNVGALTNRLYFTGSAPSKKLFYSLNIGPELFGAATLEWHLSHFDVLVPV